MSGELGGGLDGVVEAGAATQQVTPARLLIGRTGSAYRTSTQLLLRADHAFAKDALRANLSLDEPPMKDLVDRFGIFEVSTEAESSEDHLARPDRGRRLSTRTIDELRERCPRDVDLQIVIGDGLSPLAVGAQVPRLLGPLLDAATTRGWSVGQPFFVRHCRVGVINDIGVSLGARNVVLLIGERPGLATAESLSAYLAHRPAAGDTDAMRNLVSNIHSGGVGPEEAVRRIVSLVGSFELQGRSGFTVKELAMPTSLPGAPGR